MRNYSNPILLIVVRRQPMIFRADKGLEEAPSLSRKLLQKQSLVGRESRFAASERPADPPRDRGEDQPEAQYGRGHGEHLRPRKPQVDSSGGGDSRGDPQRPAS